MLASLMVAVLGAVPTRAGAQSDYRELVCSYFGSECDKAYRVMWCESRGNPMAYSAGNHGLFQLNSVHAGRAGSVEALYDPETNVRVAHSIWVDQGWAPWGCRNA